MRFVFLILILVPNIIFADIVPFVEKMKDYPKNFVVSHFVTPSVSFFGGEMGYIYTHEKNAADLNWTSIQLKDAGLITSLAVSEGLNINDLDQRNKTLKTIQSIYVTSAKGSIYRSYMGTLDKNWVEVYASKQDAQGPLFDVTLLDDRRLLAVGAFGVLLESINKGETWRSLGKQLDNPDAAHLYKVLAAPQIQQDKYGIEAFVIGEFGQVFTRSVASGVGQTQWNKFQLESESTLFDGAFLSDYWVLMFGIDGAIAAYDLRTNTMKEGQLCADVSILSVAHDSTGRNLLLSASQDIVVRVSLLDEGEATPPALTCQTYSLEKFGLNGMAVRGHQLLLTGDKGVHLENPLTLIPEFSIPMDVQWQ